MKSSWTRTGHQQGFTLVEMLIVLAVITVVMGVAFSGVNIGLQRYKVEENRLDIQQESREFLDQIVRDLHTVGYPNLRMYNANAAVLGTPAANSKYLAFGLVAVSATDIWFEGDLDGSGNVQSIRYTLQAGAGNTCPCSLQRSAVNKVNGVAPAAQAVSYAVELQNAVNMAGNPGAYTIAGSTWFTGATSAVSNDTLYATYKQAPLFAYFDQNGAPVTVPADLSGANLATGQAAVANVRTITVVLNVLAPYQDPSTKLRPAVSMRAMVKLNNL